MTNEELIKNLEEYDKEVNKLFQENKKLKSLIELLYYKIQLNDEQQALLDEILKGE